MNTARQGAAAAPLPDGQVLIAGGFLSGNILSSAELFDPATDMFTALSGSMTVPRREAAVAPLPGGRVLIAGVLGNSGVLSHPPLRLRQPEI